MYGHRDDFRQRSNSARRSRSPHGRPGSPMGHNLYDPYSPSGVDNEPENNVLYMGNVPLSWDFRRVKIFIQKKHTAKDVQHIEMLKNDQGKSNGSCLVTFNSPESCKSALRNLMGTEIDGRNIVVMHDATGKLREQLSKELRHEMETPQQNMFTKNQLVDKDNMTFGLSIKFLDSIGVQLPLISSIFILNLDFKADERKLEEVFKLAGQVLSVSLLRNKDGSSKGMAQIEYDHPVEAVQAVSLFNNQYLYDRKMCVRLNRSESKFVLPDGLKGIGEGFGPNGLPLRGVRNYVELQPLQQLLGKSDEKVNDRDTQANLPQVVFPNQPNVNNQQSVTAPNQAYIEIPQTNINASVHTNSLQQDYMANAKVINNMTNLNTGMLADGTAINLAGMQNNAVNAWISGNPTLNNTAGAVLNMTPVNALNQTASLAQIVGGVALGAGQNLQALQLLAQSQGFGNNLTPTLAIATPGTSSNVIVQGQQGYLNQNVDNTGRGYQFRNEQDMGMKRNVFDNTLDRGYDRGDSWKDDTNSNKKIPSGNMVVINNLPPSVTLSSIRDKMREVGEIKFAEMTGQGTAIVRFTNTIDAERFVHIYDRSRVDGQVIEVRMF